MNDKFLEEVLTGYVNEIEYWEDFMNNKAIAGAYMSRTLCEEKIHTWKIRFADALRDFMETGSCTSVQNWKDYEKRQDA